MSRDTSSQALIAKASKLWQLARTDPMELAEEMHTNDLAVEIRRSGLDLYIQQVQEEDQDNEDGIHEPEKTLASAEERRTVTVIRKDGTAILCEKGHLKMASWKLTGPGWRKFKAPHLYPWSNWRILEPAAHAWLHHLGITLSEGECVICPSGLTLEEMMG